MIVPPGPGPTGTPECVSEAGAFDMVGNVAELLADLVPAGSGGCDPGFVTEVLGSGVIERGGSFSGAPDGVFTAPSGLSVQFGVPTLGFRAAQ